MNRIYDAIVIGSGAAGYAAADRLFKEGITDIAVITENRLAGTSRNTGSDKQTYYKIAMDGRSSDSAYKMAEDIFLPGCCDGEKAYIQAVNSARCFLKLCEYGVAFPADEYGAYPGYKTDHDDTSRATSCGPLTSKYMTLALEREVLENNGTPVLDNRQVIKIITEGGIAAGVVVLNTAENKFEVFGAKSIIAACGAPACVYKDSVYPSSQHGMTGVLIEAGVKLCNFSQWQYGLASVDFRWNVSGSFMQVIPRFVSVDPHGTETELLTRYFDSPSQLYGFVFLKGYQWPFSYARMEESSKIDIAVHEEIKKGNRVYLDFTKDPYGYEFESLPEEAREYLIKNGANAPSPVQRLRKLNKKAIEVYSRHNIDLYSQKLKIAVCAQHNNGGVLTDNNYETNIRGLYVIGEAAGSFGLARPGGTALNDTQVGAFVAARHIKENPGKKPSGGLLEDALPEYRDVSVSQGNGSRAEISLVPAQMSESAAFIRDYEKCKLLLEKIGKLLKELPERAQSLSGYFRDRDMLVSAKALLETITAEMPQTGSRGGAVFFRNGDMVPENTFYRAYLTVTEGGKVYYKKAAPVPVPDEPFEKYLNQTENNRWD